MTTLAAPPSKTVTPKVVLGDGRIALLATPTGDRLVNVGSTLLLDSEFVRVDGITGTRGSWAVELSAV